MANNEIEKVPLLYDDIPRTGVGQRMAILFSVISILYAMKAGS